MEGVNSLANRKNEALLRRIGKESCPARAGCGGVGLALAAVLNGALADVAAGRAGGFGFVVGGEPHGR